MNRLPPNALTKTQKSMMIIGVGAAVILLVRFGGWVVIAKLMRFILPIALIVFIWKRVFRK